jgi:SAM-dependent methyltransferase
MELAGWEERYRTGHRAEDRETSPTPLVLETAARLVPGTALDLACGAGRNALWLAAHGWSVTAVDGALSAIGILRERARERGLPVDARVADLEKEGFRIERSAWDLILMCYYLQRDLFAPALEGLVPGGMLVAIVHIAEPGEEPTAHRLRPGELPEFFRGCEILHHREGRPRDRAHQRPVAEIVARRPRPAPSRN